MSERGRIMAAVGRAIKQFGPPTLAKNTAAIEALAAMVATLYAATYEIPLPDDHSSMLERGAQAVLDALESWEQAEQNRN